jgi:hypothetical protein
LIVSVLQAGDPSWPRHLALHELVQADRKSEAVTLLIGEVDERVLWMVGYPYLVLGQPAQEMGLQIDEVAREFAIVKRSHLAHIRTRSRSPMPPAQPVTVRRSSNRPCGRRPTASSRSAASGWTISRSG